MNQTPRASRLVLFPKDAQAQAPDSMNLHDGLSSAGFIGSISREQSGLYLPGPEFMSLLSFLGCSPTVATDDEMDNPNRYVIELGGPASDIKPLMDERTTPPRCPECGQSHLQLQGAVPDCEATLVCESCGFSAPPYEWNWRHRAGFGRIWINVWGVFEGEAVPGDKLLKLLERLSGFAWNYAYCR